MKNEIDLHGLSHYDAILEVEDFLLTLSVEGPFDATIITGNSYRLQRKVIEKVLDVYKFSYYIPSSNLGTIKVVYNG